MRVCKLRCEVISGRPESKSAGIDVEELENFEDLLEVLIALLGPLDDVQIFAARFNPGCNFCD